MADLEAEAGTVDLDLDATQRAQAKCRELASLAFSNEALRLVCTLPRLGQLLSVFARTVCRVEAWPVRRLAILHLVDKQSE